MFRKLARVGAGPSKRMTTSVSQQRAMDMTLTPIAIGQILASAEALTTGPLYARDGLLRGVSALNATPGTLRYRLLTVLDAPATPRVLAAVTFASSVVMLAGRGHRRIQIAAATVIGACNRLSEMRTPYGRDGADQMSSVIAQYRALSALIPDRARADDIFLRAVNLQAGISYFVSGFSKLFGSSWVQGDALGEILQTHAYGGTPAAAMLKKHARVVRFLSLITPAWEAAFPLVYVVPAGWGRLGLTAVKGFHASVAAVMELPRFFWGFSGAHGAVRYVIDKQESVHGTSRRFERVVLASAAAVVLTSGTYAAAQRQLDKERRNGLKGTRRARVGDGEVEFLWSVPPASVDQGQAPIVVLESGLGYALEGWKWVLDELAPTCHVIAYHRRGYGLTTSSASESEVLDTLVALPESSGPLVAVSHSIGLLKLAGYAGSRMAGKSISAAVLVDGTDPDLLAVERANRRRVGAFMQSQAHLIFSALTGIYNFAPSATARQSEFPPDNQSGTLQFVHSPRNIYRATREYFAAQTEGVLDAIRRIPNRYVVSSQENEIQQARLAEKLAAGYNLVQESSHLSLLGYRRFAVHVAEAVRGAIDAAS